MPKFGLKSLQNKKTLHPLLQEIVDEAIKHTDFSIIWGYRTKEKQNEAYAKGNSQLRFPLSKHNRNPSEAMDLVPWPVDWNNIPAFEQLSKLIKWIAKEKEIEIVWGGDWKRFRDYAHYELRLK